MSDHKHQHTGQGPSGNCICVRCNVTIPHKKGVPCKEERCPECGHPMMREGSEHHTKYLERKQADSK